MRKCPKCAINLHEQRCWKCGTPAPNSESSSLAVLPAFMDTASRPENEKPLEAGKSGWDRGSKVGIGVAVVVGAVLSTGSLQNVGLLARFGTFCIVAFVGLILGGTIGSLLFPRR
jgi:hypothetical protein